jgi:diadenosine tetraphosphate (Ap4A) HIT family hydrolase
MTSTSSLAKAEPTSSAVDDCWFCNPAVRGVEPPGGWIYQDDWWRVGHGLPGWGPAGTTIVESRRHFLDVSEMRPDEANTFGPVLGRVVGAIKRTVHADRVYTWSTMDRFAHHHIWLIPWWRDSPRHGPDYLLHSVSGGGVTEAEAMEVVSAMREILTAPAVS